MDTAKMTYIGYVGGWGHLYCRALAGCKAPDKPQCCLHHTDRVGEGMLVFGRCKYLASCPTPPVSTDVQSDFTTENKRSAGDSAESPKPSVASANRNPVMPNSGHGHEGGVLDG